MVVGSLCSAADVARQQNRVARTSSIEPFLPGCYRPDSDTVVLNAFIFESEQ